MHSGDMIKARRGYRYSVIAAVIWVGMFFSHAYAAGDKDHQVTIVVPVKVLQGLIDEVLPVEIPMHEEISGTFWIRSIKHLRLGVDKVWFTADISAENMAYKGKIAGLPANLHFDEVDSTLQCEASIRYDMEKRLLYVRPKIAEQENKRDILWLLVVSIFGDGEYPVEIKKLKGIETKISNKAVKVDMDISNIYTVTDRLFIALQHRVKAGQE